MSQHYYYAKYDNKPIKVQLGWDKPMQGFYMVISYIDEMGEETDDLLYSNLFESVMFSNNIGRYIAILAKYDIVLPQDMIERVLHDAKINAINVSQEWGSSVFH